jgi:hypothetical protein
MSELQPSLLCFLLHAALSQTCLALILLLSSGKWTLDQTQTWQQQQRRRRQQHQVVLVLQHLQAAMG